MHFHKIVVTKYLFENVRWEYCLSHVMIFQNVIEQQ
jgi:hypothetical protein